MKKLISTVVLTAGAITAQVMLRPHPLDVAGLSAPDGTKTLMRSGFDYEDANYDSGNLIRVEPAGKPFTDPDSEWVLFEADGPGVLTSIWFTGKSKKGQPYIGGKLNFYFDGEAKPSFAARLPELFESGSPWPAPLAEKSHGGWVAYAPVYYARSLKITLTEHNDGFTHRKNGRKETIPHIYHQFTYQKLARPVKSVRPDQQKYAAWRPDTRGTEQRRTVQLAAAKPAAVFQAKGKGILNELRLKWTSGDADSATLRIVADGAATADMKVSEFWGFSRKLRPEAKMQSLLLGVEDDGTYYCRFPMPFRKEFRIELIAADGATVDVRTLARKGWSEREHFYFRANRVTDVTEPGRDIKILEAAGRGHFIGAVLEIPDQSMEGDDRFYVDGEKFPPSWHGTGTEDYFRCGWYFYGGPITRPLYGMLDKQKPKIAYRFHIADRVNFTKSAVIGFEHGHKNDYIGPYNGVAFWYSERNR